MKRFAAVTLAALMLLTVFAAVASADEVDVRGPVYESNSTLQALIDASGGPLVMNSTNFAGFFYDLNKDVGTEQLSITKASSSGSNVIDKDGLQYSTKEQNIAFKSDVWKNDSNHGSTYPVMGFFADKYVPIKGKPDKLAKLITDNKDKHTLKTGDKFDLGGGYTLQAKQVDVNGKKVWLEFDKDGVYIDEKVVGTDTGEDHTWECTVDTQGETSVPVLRVHVDTVFQGAVDSIATIDATWLIDYQNTLTIHSDDSFGKLNDVSIGDNGITIQNKDTITLTKDSDQEIGNNLFFRIADDSKALRFYLFKKYTDPGTYEIRGQLATESTPNPMTWDYKNFAGFFYDLNKNVGTESLTISRDSSDKRKIPKNNMVYSTQIQNVGFKSTIWNNNSKYSSTYPVEGFFAQKYVPIKGKPDKLAKLITDNKDKHTLKTGDKFDLGAGYTLQAKQVDVNGKKVWLEFDKDGVYIDEKVVGTDTGDDHTWEDTLDTQGETSVPVLRVHVDTVFQGAVDSIATIDATWLIDYQNTLTIHSDDSFGKFDDVSIGDNGVSIRNKNDVTLSKDSDVDLGQGLKFKVADNDTLRFYPFVEQTISGNNNSSQQGNGTTTPISNVTTPVVNVTTGGNGTTPIGNGSTTITETPAEGTTPAPANNSSTTKPTPDFTAITLGISGLLAVLYLIRRNS